MRVRESPNHLKVMKIEHCKQILRRLTENLEPSILVFLDLSLTLVWLALELKGLFMLWLNHSTKLYWYQQ